MFDNSLSYGHNTFYPLFFDGHLCCFHFLTIMNNAVMNINMQHFVQTHIFISPEYIPVSGIARSYAHIMSNVLRKCQGS